MLAEVADVFLDRGHNLSDLPVVEVYSARETARQGDCDAALAVIRAAADHLFRHDRLLLWGVPATTVLVETLLDRGPVVMSPKPRRRSTDWRGRRPTRAW